MDRVSEERILKTLSRIKSTQDGIDLIEYLQTLSKDNYIAFKREGSSMNDVHKGYALAIDSLLETFESCEIKIKALEKSTEDEASLHY
jgi:hypothetical protein